MTQSDYAKFNLLFLRYTTCSVQYTTEYQRWRDAGNSFNDEYSDELNRRGDALDKAGNDVREFVKGFVVED